MHLLYFSPASSVVSKITAPKYAPVPISGHNEYITFFTKRNFADMIKVKILSWKDCCCCSVTLRVQPMDCSSPGFPAHHISWNLFKLMSIKSLMPSNHLILRHPLLLLPSIFLSIRVFSKESVLHIRWPKYWSFSFSISPSNEHPGLISFRMDWLDLLAVQGTLKSLLQHHSSKASILQH